MAPAPRPQARSALLLAALGLALLSAGDSAARKFQMSGTWAMRRGGFFVPLQFAPNTLWVHTSLGDLSMALGIPNGPVPGNGKVTLSGSAPAALRIPPHRFTVHAHTAFDAGFSIVQIATALDADGPAEAALLAPGGGPGSFTWCPGDPACAPSGPPQGAGPRNGRVIYRAGANRFGGAMQMLLTGALTNSFTFNFVPFQVGHVSALWAGAQHTGGPYSFMNTIVQPPTLVVTQPTMPPTPGMPLILYPGPKLTTMFGLTTTGTGPTFARSLPRTTVNTGFPFTTGTVFAQQTLGSSPPDFFTVMGSDLRTPLGAGNLSLVAGGLSLLTTQSTNTTTFASFGKVWMTLTPPVPSLSPAGIVAAAALVLLAVGWVRRGRR